MTGRGLRGHAARRTRAALGHALAFPTWRSLAREQRLGRGDAVALMSVLVEGAARAAAPRIADCFTRRPEIDGRPCGSARLADHPDV